MENYKNFDVAGYVWAYYLDRADEAEMQHGIDFYKQYLPLDKVYLENHRGLVDVPKAKMIRAKNFFEKNGIKTAGGITSTGFVGERKPSIYDTFCYTDPRHREYYLSIVKEIAEVFDEIILDDYFFTACRCEMCIKAKGNQTWSEYRTKLMADFSKEIVSLAKSINPEIKFVVKFPNWYESFLENGYSPEIQKNIFDGVYTGTETRDSRITTQHLQRYLSYGVLRLMENTAPGQNGGGWIDKYGSEKNLNEFLEQGQLTLLAKAKELSLFNFEHLTDSLMIPPLGKQLVETDKLLGELGNPIGVSVYEPYTGAGEEQLFSYLGMGGIPMEPVPYFDGKAPVVFLSERTTEDEQIVDHLKKYVQSGGNAVITTGFLRKTLNKGIGDMTTLRPTGRHASGTQFLIENYNYTSSSMAEGKHAIQFEVLEYKNNASWSDITLIADECNFPILSEDAYGQGRLFVLNVPDNFADFYKLPAAVWEGLAKHLSMGQRVYMGSGAKYNLFAYDNNRYVLRSYQPVVTTCSVIVRGACEGIQNLSTGEMITNKKELPRPGHRMDCCAHIDEPFEDAYEIVVPAGGEVVFQVL